MTRNLAAPSIMLLDAETSGLYIDSLPMDDPGQPWATQIAAGLCNDAGEFTNFFSHIIKADGRTVKNGALEVHGITKVAAAQVGIPEPRVLGTLLNMISTTPPDRPLRFVTYGDFDGRVLSSLFARYAISQGKSSTTFDRQFFRRPNVEFVNLMHPYCQQVCKLKGEFDDYRWPSLDEAAFTILGIEPREGYHDAFQDMLILKQLYFWFQEKGWFKDRDPATD